jgi:YfiR/HmsC-like
MKRAASLSWSESRIRVRAFAGSKSLKALSLGVLLVTASSVQPRANPESSGTSEYDVKAAFLFHFAQFVEWPSGAFKDAGTPLIYCTTGEDVFRGSLDESVKGKRIGNHELRVRHLKERERIDGCHVLFLSTVQRGLQAELLASANGHPVLTVGETEHFVQQGGIIGFCLEDKKIRFEINLEPAGRAQLKISAKLLALARTVLGNPRED